MPRRASAYPTQAELEILNVLWAGGTGTVRDVHGRLQSDLHRTSLTTTLKMLQVMTDKGLTRRSDTRPHRYSPAMPRRQAQAGMLRDMVQRVFDGSVRKMLVRAVEDIGVSPRELADVRKLLNQIGKGRGE